MEFEEFFEMPETGVCDISIREKRLEPPITFGKEPILNKFLPDYYFLRLGDLAKFEVKKEAEKTFINIDIKKDEEINIIKSWIFGSVLTASMIETMIYHSS